MAHEGLWQQLMELDGQRTAERANCRYVSEPPRYCVTLLNTEYVVSLSDKRIYSGPSGSSALEAGFIEQLCILAYLINCQDLPFADKLVKPQSLPGGQFFFRGPHALPTGKLEKAFGECPEDMYRISERLNAKRCEFGDASIEVPVLPRIRLTLIIWHSDEEFEARASILLDETAAKHLPLDALFAAICLSVDTVAKAAAKGG